MSDERKTVTVHYVNRALGWECDIEIPVNDKTKAAHINLGGGARMGLSELVGATMKSDWGVRNG